MLEEKIDALIIAINSLCAVMTNTKTAPKSETPIQEEPPKVEPTKEPAPDFDALRDELQNLCLALVRKDRSKKEKIVKKISEFGAELIKDVPDAKLNELKKELEAL